MAKKIIAGNWKMNLNISEGLSLIDKINDYCEEHEPNGLEVIVAPSYIFLPDATKHTHNKKLKIAAQNCSEHESGAYTGEVSMDMLSSLDVDAVIIGHSERRLFYGDRSSNINAKLKLALEAKILPILCVGEELKQRQAHRQQEVVGTQLKEALHGLKASRVKDMVIAYEPVWAIGTGETASPEQAREMHAFIRSWLTEEYGSKTADSISILYGGSVKPENAGEIFSQPDVDGGLIGGASLKFDQFSELIRIGVEKL